VHAADLGELHLERALELGRELRRRPIVVADVRADAFEAAEAAERRIGVGWRAADVVGEEGEVGAGVRGVELDLPLVWHQAAELAHELVQAAVGRPGALGGAEHVRVVEVPEHDAVGVLGRDLDEGGVVAHGEQHRAEWVALADAVGRADGRLAVLVAAIVAAVVVIGGGGLQLLLLSLAARRVPPRHSAAEGASVGVEQSLAAVAPGHGGEEVGEAAARDRLKNRRAADGVETVFNIVATARPRGILL
jgi:hypothetical protein